MSCSTRGCKNEPVPSNFVPGWLWCSACKGFTEEAATAPSRKIKRQGDPPPKKKEEEEKKKEDPNKSKIAEARARKKKKNATPTLSKSHSKKRKSSQSRSAKVRTSKEAEDGKASCEEHPNYGVIRKPRTKCKTCWEAYATKHPERVK